MTPTQTLATDMHKKQAPAPPSIPAFKLSYGRDIRATAAQHFTLANLRAIVFAADAHGFPDTSDVVIMGKTSVFARDAIYIKASADDATS